MRAASLAALGLIITNCSPPPKAESTDNLLRTVATNGDDSLMDDGKCDASGLQDLIGETVSDELGERIQRESGARTLRWGPPNSAWTMDYREDRVNVRYDDDMKITAITCG